MGWRKNWGKRNEDQQIFLQNVAGTCFIIDSWGFFLAYLRGHIIYRGSIIDTSEDIIRVVKESSVQGKNITQMTA